MGSLPEGNTHGIVHLGHAGLPPPSSSVKLLGENNLDVGSAKDTQLIENEDCFNPLQKSHCMAELRVDCKDGNDNDNGNGCTIFQRKHILLTESVEQAEDNSEQAIALSAVEKVPDIAKMEDVSPARSKRARKDNMQKDYIPWSAFGRSPVKRSEKSKSQGVKHTGKLTENEWSDGERKLVSQNADEVFMDQSQEDSRHEAENQRDAVSPSKVPQKIVPVDCIAEKSLNNTGIRKCSCLDEHITQKRKLQNFILFSKVNMGKQNKHGNCVCEQTEKHGKHVCHIAQQFEKHFVHGHSNSMHMEMSRACQKRKLVSTVVEDGIRGHHVETGAGSSTEKSIEDNVERDECDSVKKDDGGNNEGEDVENNEDVLMASTTGSEPPKLCEVAVKHCCIQMRQRSKGSNAIVPRKGMKQAGVEVEALQHNKKNGRTDPFKEGESDMSNNVSSGDLKYQQVKCIDCKKYRRLPVNEVAETCWLYRDHTWVSTHRNCNATQESKDGRLQKPTCSTSSLKSGAADDSSSRLGDSTKFLQQPLAEISTKIQQRVVDEEERDNRILASKNCPVIKSSDLGDTRLKKPHDQGESEAADLCAIKGMPWFKQGREDTTKRQKSLLEASISTDSCSLHMQERTAANEQPILKRLQPREGVCYGKRVPGFNVDAASDEDCSSTDNHNSFCEKCRIGGDLICCDGKGCKTTYHLSCLDPPLMEVPPDDWYCPDCAYKKISYGVYAISKGIESIWDVKSASDVEETGTSKNKGFPLDGSIKVTRDSCSISVDDELLQNKGKEVLRRLHSSLSRGKYSHSNFSTNEAITENACIAAVDILVDEEVADTDKQESVCKTSQEGKVSSLEARQSNRRVSLHIDQDAEKSLLERRPRLSQTVKGPENNAMKLYFVKYKRAAHVHNQWIPENDLMKEAPKLLANFKKKLKQEKVFKWNPDWADLCRIIGKKVTMPPKRPGAGRGRGSGYVPNRCVEWCVKWKGLGYEHCTWEPGDTGVLTSTHALELIQEYEDRSKEARQRGQQGRLDNVQKLRMGEFSRLNVQPHWIKGVKLNSQQLEALNTMRNYWQRCIDGIVVDGVRQQSTVTAIAFLLSLVKEFEVVKPVLVAVPLARVAIWESQFAQWAPTVNVVTYSGTKEARELIQRYEFYSEDGYFMVQIVLASFDVVNTDLECLKELEWEALVVDECQCLRSTKSSRFVQQLTSDYRLLLFSEPLKDNVDDYIQTLSFIQNDSDLLEPDIADLRHSKDENELLEDLKRRMNKHIVYEYRRAALAGNYLQEYWVPVEMTDAQVQEYCKLQINRSDILSGSSTKRGDTALLLQGLLLKLRECCNHPHLVNSGLQRSVSTGLTGKELLELRLHTSGKLQLLEMLLFKAKSEGKRVLVLTQMHLRSEKSTQMEILDHYLRHRFGIDSYERVDGGLAIHKKQASVHRFNGKDSLCFVFLLDKRACGPAIKLPSVNFVVIFDSDWNPESDIQALQRVHFNFEAEDIKVYRLYTPHSVEERALIAARRDSVLDLNHKSFTVAVCQRLLRWGATRNFKLLGKNVNLLNRLTYNEENVRILLGQAPAHDTMEEDFIGIPWKMILDCREAGRYGKGVSLYSEIDEELSSEDQVPPSKFWSEILQDKHIETHDVDKRRLHVVGCCEDTPFTNNKNNSQEDELTKKKRLTDAQYSVPDSAPEDCGHFSSLPNERMETCIQEYRIPEINCAHQSIVVDETDRCRLLKEQNDNLGCKQSSSTNEGIQEACCGARTEQQSLYPSMKADLSVLIQALQLQGDVAKQAERLLLFSVNHLKLQKYSKSLLHSIELSTCWLAAQQQNYPIDRCATQAVAESCFGLQLSQVNSMFAKLEEQCSMNAVPAEELISDAHLSSECTTEQVHQNSDKVVPSSNCKPDEEHNQAPPLCADNMVEQQVLFAESQNIASTVDLDNHVTTDKQQQEILTGSTHNLLEADNRQESEHHVIKLQNPAVQSVPQPHSPQTLASMKESLSSQKGERMQTLLKRQKMEISKFYDYENNSKDKLRREFQIECSKVMASRNSEELKASMLNKQRYLYTQKMKDLECILKKERQKLVDKQYEVRDKENKLIASHLERINSGQIPSPLPNFEEIIEIDINLPPPMYFESDATTGASSVDSAYITVTTGAVQSLDAFQNSTVLPISQAESRGMPLRYRSYDLNQESSSSGPAAEVSCRDTEMCQSTQQGLISQNFPVSSAAMPPSIAAISQEMMESRDRTLEVSSGEIVHGTRGHVLGLPSEQLAISTRPLQPENCHSLTYTQQQAQCQVYIPHLQQQAHAQARVTSVEVQQSQHVSGLVFGQGGPGQHSQHFQQHHQQQSSQVDQIERAALQPLSLHSSHGQQWQCDNQISASSIGSVGRSAAMNSPVTCPVTCGTLLLPVASRGNNYSILGVSPVPQMTQNAASSRLPLPYHNDPLGQECLRLKKEQEKVKCIYEAEKERLKAQYARDQEALRKKFDNLLQEEKRTYIQKVATLEVNLKRAEMNRRLAETFRMKIGNDSLSAMNSGFSLGTANGVHDPHSRINLNQTRIQQFLPLNARASSPAQVQITLSTANADINGCSSQPALVSVSGIGNLAVFQRASSSVTLVGSSAGIHTLNMPMTGTQVHSGAFNFNVQGQSAGLQLQGTQLSRTAVAGSGHSRISLQASDQSTLFPEASRLRSTQHLLPQSRESPSRMPSSASPLFPNPPVLHELSISTSNQSFQYQSLASTSPGLYNTSSFLVSSCVSNQYNALNSRSSVFSVSTYSTTVASHSGAPSVPTSIDLQASLPISTISPDTEFLARESVNLARPPAVCTSMTLGMIDVNDFPPDSTMLDLQQEGYIDSQERPLNGREDIPLSLHHSGNPIEAASGEEFLTEGRQAGLTSHCVALTQGNTVRTIENVIYLSDDD